MTDLSLWSTFVLWILNKNKSLSNDSYSQQLQSYASFNSIHSFYSIYNYMNKPSTVYNNKLTTDDTIIYHIFRYGISPLWEDPANASGGRLILRIKKYINTNDSISQPSSTDTYIDRIWEDIILMYIGDEYNISNDISGIVLTQKNNEYFINVWNQSTDNDIVNKLRHAVKNTLNIPMHMMNTVIDYKPHYNALKQAQKQ